ncbi:MAG: HEPN domain-containing protein [Microcoleus sp. PH2017_29_MFU_D_A]|uniref:HEPN domain-containing protein n=1 Tax=unclassified Microcoleus TaxID=2642155 RepID=UPI001DA6F007|nr:MULTISPECIES: HEPN domain-containing protein [unclassified Microcoleus]MCC3418641.1 HEPN domain-containing protein [Microcoleus sp. PH2017_07_MST_O_A]MCC3513141.1 HEPN domain-containing protein [Microcoleus sp. PH2017_17_BER_D_A]TAG63644.1 MAG: HEPN domain-containing protein [Oscillatoriales cyanobacterium]MCC3427121.1 HEPN domain-containing protein [Microcoleus sp. PH2017_01_SCD_O_A]MCC3606561.1 HEPN domain-containing protein [Microcoleus sp. PH2017_29_MFU_D_A]
MKFDWSEYLNLAQELAASNEESKLRSAVSRAYYSVFCLARNYLRDIEQDPRLSRNKTYDINDHQYVAEEFIYNRAKSQKITEIGRNLTRLRKIRNQADYEDTIFQLQKEVVRSLSLAQNIISALRELSD